MSSHTGVVTARDVLGWAISQHVFTEIGTRQRDPHQPVTSGIDGPWTEILDALMTAAGEGLADPTSGIDRNGWLDGFEEYVESRCLENLVRTFRLTEHQTPIVMKLAEKIRLFFDGTICIGTTGFDGPLDGALGYHSRFDYTIQIPDWAASRAT